MSQIVGQYFSVKDGALCIGGVPVAQIADKFGTPAFVYDQGILEAKLNALRSTLPRSFQISYSVKANPAQEILKFFTDRECGLEIASSGELEQALAASCPADRVIFAGPGKTVAELELALQNGVKEIHVESTLELERIHDLCQRHSWHADIALRVNPSAEAQGGAMRMGGKPAPFGIDEECIEPVVEQVLKDPYMTFRGIHLFTGTQILGHQILITQYRKAIEIARRIGKKFGCPIHTVDFGGGLGIPYFPGEKALDLDQLRSGLELLSRELESDKTFAATEFMVEPGRFLVGECGVYVTRINDIKISRGKKFLVLDGGMNHHLAASGNLGQTIKRNYPVALLNKISMPAVESVEVVGPLCTPLDTLARNVSLPEPAVGDLFGIFQSGAYARSASPLGFLSHRTPPEILVSAGNTFLVRNRGENSSYLQDQRGAQVAQGKTGNRS
ncbi:MAG TPA: type III PLP-dependent enzyme [Candidatus Angelobacter sp.]